MSSRWNAHVWRALFALVCSAALAVASMAPAAAAPGNDRNKDKEDKRSYTVSQGPCKVDTLPRGAHHQWTPGGESIVHKVQYGQGLQDIAWKYGFKGDNAFKRLWDANPQLSATWLERPGITIRIPVCGTELRRRTLPKPPPPPEPEPEPEPEAAAADQADAAEQAPEPEPEPEPKQGSQAPAVPTGVWDRLAGCESGGDWSINTGNGYYGGLQFSESSWRAVGGTGLPHQHSREEQILRGKKLQAIQGWGAWPACSAKLGLG